MIKMSPIKDFHLVYNVLNSEETFSEGDTVGGTVSFTLTKETKVKNILVKLKGQASVSWSEGMGDDSSSYSDHRRYFKVKQYLATPSQGGSTLHKGFHSLNFQLAIPQGNFPSSFKDPTGKIYYTLEAKISRSWRMPSTVQRELNFLSKSPTNHVQMLCPYSSSICKDVGVFSKGSVRLFVTVNKNVYTPGESVAVVVNISNQSSTKLKPKIKLQQFKEYRAGSSVTASNRTLGKAVVDVINGNSEGTVTCQIPIPGDIIPTIRNCEILSVEYCLKVYLDISFLHDPEIQLQLLIIPSTFAYLYSAEAAGAPSYSDFPPPVPSSFCGYPAPNVSQGLNTRGFENQLPPKVTPSGLPTLGHQALTTPPLFQEEEPPSYQSLWPPANTHNYTGSNKK